jgi:hypothetical protein
MIPDESPWRADWYGVSERMLRWLFALNLQGWRQDDKPI